MTANNSAVFGIYADTEKTERALETLLCAGLDITALLDDRRRTEAGHLVSVHCGSPDEIRRAKDLLRSTGAQDIASTSEASWARVKRLNCIAHADRLAIADHYALLR